MLLLATVFVACSDDDDDDNGNGNGDEKGWVVTMNKQRGLYVHQKGEIELQCAGSGKMEIDWGDGTITKDLELPLYEEYDEDFEDYTEFTHVYDKEGTYTITLKGEGKLTYLRAFWTELTAINLTQNPHLIELDLSANEIKTLDVSKCTNLASLNCEECDVKTLDITKCTKLVKIHCGDNNELSALDVTKCTELISFSCCNTKLTTLDLSKCTKLDYIECYNNQLTSLNINGCSVLEELYAEDNQLDETAINQIYNGLPDRTGKEAGYVNLRNNNGEGDKTIVERKNWNVSL